MSSIDGLLPKPAPAVPMGRALARAPQPGARAAAIGRNHYSSKQKALIILASLLLGALAGAMALYSLCSLLTLSAVAVIHGSTGALLFLKVMTQPLLIGIWGGTGAFMGSGVGLALAIEQLY